MLSLGALAFAAPWALVGLASLPVLWWLLRVMPPRPRRIEFPPTRLLFDIRPKEETPSRTPWWLTLLRLTAAALVILAAAGPIWNPQTGVGVPLPYSTPYQHGFGNDPNDPTKEDLTEVKQAIAGFRDAGLQLLNVSLGSPYFNPHIGRPFEKPDDGNYESPEHPLLGVDRHFRIAGELQRAFPDLPMVGTGYSWLQIYAIHAGASNITDGSIRFFGMGRNALAYPEFARDALRTGVLDDKRVCRTVTFCTYLMRQKHNELGQYETGCPPYDKEVYGPIIKLARQTKPK